MTHLLTMYIQLLRSAWLCEMMVESAVTTSIFCACLFTLFIFYILLLVNVLCFYAKGNSESLLCMKLQCAVQKDILLHSLLINNIMIHILLNLCCMTYVKHVTQQFHNVIIDMLVFVPPIIIFTDKIYWRIYKFHRCCIHNKSPPSQHLWWWQ